MFDASGNFPRTPEIGPAVFVPIAFDPITWIETPEYQKLSPREGPGAPYMLRSYGTTYPTESKPSILEEQHVRTFPANSAERIRYFDEFVCSDIPPDQITTTGTAFELTRVHLQKYGTGVISRIAIVFDDVTALDAAGDPLFQFGPLDGQRPCRWPLVSPDPAGGTLAVEFRLLATEVPSFSVNPTGGFPVRAFGIPVSSIPADRQIRQPWTDMRMGYITRWADLLQYVSGENILARLFVTFVGLPNRWRIRIGGRLGGFWNSAGSRGVALDAATRRTY